MSVDLLQEETDCSVGQSCCCESRKVLLSQKREVWRKTGRSRHHAAGLKKALAGGVCLGMTLTACGGQTRGKGLQCGPLALHSLNVVIIQSLLYTWENRITKTFFY